ncbi:MAG: hypothetical protein J6D18_04105 [Erysipelotrichaceae bacterium]|nr:hypothetical protein [Erysipelotrichaceae bacterium]
MTKDLLKEYVDCGREIEFKYNDKMYSITYGVIDDHDVISFCEFDQKTTEVRTFEELLTISREGATVLQMWESLTEEDVWIY